MDNNLRRAYLQEELGFYLLRGLAAVAPVPRPQDVGLDAIATLLRADKARQLTAGDSFYVQLKAASVRSVGFTGPAVKWLYRLELPFYVGSVDPSSSSIILYTTHELTNVFSVRTDYTAIHLHLDRAQDRGPGADVREIALGKPVLVWSVADLQSTEVMKRSYDILNEWLRIDCRSLAFRSIGLSNWVEWKTGERPVETEIRMPGVHVRDRSEIKAAMEAAAPGLFAYAYDCFADGDQEGVAAVMRLAEQFAARNVKPPERQSLPHLFGSAPIMKHKAPMLRMLASMSMQLSKAGAVNASASDSKKSVRRPTKRSDHSARPR